MFFGGHCPPSERFDSPVGDGGSTKMWKPLLLKPGGVDDAEAARSRFLVGAVACTDLPFTLPSAGDLASLLSGMVTGDGSKAAGANS